MIPKNLYLILAVVGAFVPYLFFVQHFQVAGYGLQTVVDAVSVNGAAGGFGADLLISSCMFWIAMFGLERRGQGQVPWLYAGINFLIRLFCALALIFMLGAARRRPGSADGH